MFGESMMQKLQEVQLKVEETKARLDTITVDGVAGNGKVKVVITGNRTVKHVQIEGELASYEQEEMEDLLIIAFNNAIQKADQVNESEMRAVSAGLLPGM